MLVLSTTILAAALQKNLGPTLGQSYAQILMMGEQRWIGLYTKRKGGDAINRSYGVSVYGDALGWRNDRLLKGRPSALRTRLDAFSSDVQGIAYDLTGGGSAWTILDGYVHRDLETALYRVLTHAGGAPKRLVSDVKASLDALERATRGIKPPEARRDAREGMAKVRRSFTGVAAEAARLSRPDSDVVLEFCRVFVAGVAHGTKPR